MSENGNGKGEGVPTTWGRVPFETFFENVTHSSRKLPRENYQMQGKYPVIDQGEQEIGGYTDDETLVHPGPLPVIVFGDHTRRVKYSPHPFVQGADGVKVLAPRHPLFAKYGFWVLKSAAIPSRGYARHFSIVRKLNFPVAPLPEEHRIVEAIESYFTRLDDAVATLERVRRKLKRYRASLLKAAVEGRLVPTEAELAGAETRGYEPGSVLLNRILTDRRRRWETSGRRGKYPEPATPATAELPELPEGWCWTTVDGVASLVTDGDHNPPKRAKSGIPHLTARNIKNGAITFHGCSYVNAEGFEQTRSRYEPQTDDVIITCVGTVGEVALVPPGCVFSADRNLAAVRTIPEGILPRFLATVLVSPRIRGRLMAASGSTAQPHLYLGDLRAQAIPLPPHAEQVRILAELGRLLTVSDAMSTALGHQTARCTRLRQAILKWAFEGKLADQDSNDEPASVLLERIRAEREATREAKRNGSPRWHRRKSA